jgi:hypothetical protein
VLLADLELVRQANGRVRAAAIARQRQATIRQCLAEALTKAGLKWMTRDCHAAIIASALDGIPQPAAAMPHALSAPTSSAASTDRRCLPTAGVDYRFRRALHRQHSMTVRKCVSDGNCLYRALSDQLHGNQDQHRQLRAAACDYQQQRWGASGEEPSSADDERIAQQRADGVWGTTDEIQALSSVLRRRILVYVYSNSDGFCTMTPHVPCDATASELERTPLSISLHNWNHFNSLHAEIHR